MATPTLDLIFTPFGAQLTPLSNAFVHNSIVRGFEDVEVLSLAALCSVGIITEEERDRICSLPVSVFMQVRAMLAAFYLLACGEDF